MAGPPGASAGISAQPFRPRMTANPEKLTSLFLIQNRNRPGPFQGPGLFDRTPVGLFHLGTGSATLQVPPCLI